MGAVGDEAWHGGRRGAARRGMGAPSRGGLGRADNAVKKRGVAISIGCRNIDGVDRGESVGVPVGPVTVLERARSRVSDFFKIPNVCL
jgi:hypothetical protein